MDTAMVARNALRHYRMKGGVPVWNPTLGHYYILRTTGAKLHFDVPSHYDYVRVAKAGRRPRINKEMRARLDHMKRILDSLPLPHQATQHNQ